MKKFTKLLSAVTALAVVATAGITASVNASAEGAEEAAANYSVKEYTPDKYDLIDFYGAGGDIEPSAGDGVTTFAHVGLITPMEGANINFNTNFNLLSKQGTDIGGDGVDGWLTYSFTKEAIVATEGDKVVPNYGSPIAPQGIFMHVTNYSSDSAPNCVEVQFVQSDGTNGNTPVAASIFLDNAVNVPFNFSLAQAEDGTYTWTVTKLEDNSVLKEVTGLAFNPDNFVNEDGQTYFSTAIYEGVGCDGNHWEHRGVAIFNVDAYNVDVAAEDVVLSQTEYVYEDAACTPEVTVTLDGATLVNGVDYGVEYVNNDAVGTATAKVIFYGELGGNVVEKEFVINAPVEDDPIVDPGTTSENPSDEPSDETSDTNSETNGSSETTSDSNENEDDDSSGCFSAVTFGGLSAILALGGVMLFAKKRK